MKTGQQIRWIISDRALEAGVKVGDYEGYKKIEEKILITLSDEEIVSYNEYMAHITGLI